MKRMRNRRLALAIPFLLAFSVSPYSAFAQGRTSENNESLARALQNFPDADANDDGVLTPTEAAAYRELLLRQRREKEENEGERSRIEPTYADVAYGPFEANRLDLWIAESDRPTPLVVCIHGGGFMGGDKSTFHQTGRISQFLEAGVSVAAINYRLTDGGVNPFPIPMTDAARAIQFLRYKADEYNLDKTRVAATGGSAGGCLSMWLAYHDDLAYPDDPDPVLRESTRLTCIAPSAGQPTLDFATFADWFGCERLTEHAGGRPLFAIAKDADWEQAVRTPEFQATMREASPITHLTKDDPPAFLSYGQPDSKVTETTEPNVWVHHPRLGIKLKEQADAIGVPCYVQYPDGPEIKEYANQTEFLIEVLNGD